MRPQASPAYERNREPIARALGDVLPAKGTVLELASGSGAHAGFFAQRFPSLVWQPSDVDPVAVESCRAWQMELERGNLLPPLELDVSRSSWPAQRYDAILAINLLHISPYPIVPRGLFAGAARVLAVGGPVVLYGPFFRDDHPTARSNLEFDASLRSRNPEWGVRRLGDVVAIARESGFELERIVEMPANNVVVVVRKQL